MSNHFTGVILSLLILHAPHLLYGADSTHSFSGAEQLFRHIVLAEPQAKHPSPYALNIDSTKTAAAIACVDKEWNALHKQYIAKPREAFMQAHQQHFDAVHLNSALFNRSAQCCCLVSENERIKAFFGTEPQLNVITIRPWHYGRPEPQHIPSTMITYRNAQAQKKVAPAFQFILDAKPRTPSLCDSTR